MAVFTEVSFEQAAELIAGLNMGRLTSLKGIAAGIENTNYFADTTQGQYVLTVFERLTFDQLPFYLHLMKHLASKGLAVPNPQADASGNILHRLNDKPAVVVNRLAGRCHLSPNRDHCAQVGAGLAKMHLAGRDYTRYQPNLRGLSWWAQTVPLVLPFLSPEQKTLIESELQFQQQLAGSEAYASLTRGPIHADLFRDNVLFDGDRLSGFFDFYFAGVDTDLFDVAVCLNDWCIELDSGELVVERAQAFVDAYHLVRPLAPVEVELLPALMRAGALRFWISRLWDLHLPRPAAILQPHDPRHFERVLRRCIGQPWKVSVTQPIHSL